MKMVALIRNLFQKGKVWIPQDIIFQNQMSYTAVRRTTILRILREQNPGLSFWMV